MKIMVSDKLAAEGVRKMEAAGHEVLKAWDEPKEKLPQLIADCDALVIRSATKANKALIDAAPKLKVIGRAGIGLDNVDVEHAKSKGIVVVNTPTATTISVAELTFTFILASYRDIITGTNTTKAGKWEKKTLKGNEVYGKTLGVAGIGRIGQAVAERAVAFGMNVLAYDPYVKSDKYENVTLDDLAARSDFITLHLPLTPETKHMISKKQFDSMKNGVVILNVARGGTIDENALYEAMKSGKVKAACLDVFEVEPPTGNKLLELPNLLCTPHIGAQTAEGQTRAGIMVAEAVLEKLAGK
ncbi:MAG: hydroxyacid dehydrogenase [Candidatus Thermoplasmatota archaeon]|nr:hydroxyacid dehydrogenase [Euryarchaeota archaeon]MBU4033079.1 hydroxyacid dehydrogenase [Candidatus Thermoplasmatota archaeon]MBU4070706.1 hydroxyacid dehydrogenase [Candidatus Thermoplasmatota archaeon]MBU4143367.1 hydroxyacid dehydrogenase [Candidatus Thermoplasmatota archaeon]MBU4591193.1 hydroxyacid dehydrogenase [Candidatus Thermoplasmatota archaeon]